LQDFIAPFYLFIKSSYLVNYIKHSGNTASPEILLKSGVRVSGPFKTGLQYSYDLKFSEDGLDKFMINGNQKISGEWVRVKDI